MTDNNDKLLDKIRKILALASSPNEHEAARAMERAQAMLVEHNLSMSDVAMESKAEDEVIVDGVDDKTDSVPWIRRLAMGVASLYFCKYFFSHIYDPRPNSNRIGAYKRRDRHNFVGAPHNTAVAKMMFVYLVATVDRLARDGARSVPAKEKSKYLTSFKAACAGRLCTRINERIAAAKRGELKTEGGTTLPAVIYDDLLKKAQDFMDEKYKDMRAKKVRVTQSHAKGVSDGYNAGSSISLDGQVTHKSARQIR